MRIDAGPADGGVERGEAHLAEEADVLLPSVIEVRSLVVGVGDVVEELVVGACRQVVELVHGASGAVGVPEVDEAKPRILRRSRKVNLDGTLAALVPSALNLLGADGSSPQKLSW